MRIFTALFFFLAPAAFANDIEGRVLEYKSGPSVCEGYLVEHADDKKRPGVLVVHDIGGPSKWFREVATKVAKMGYTVLAVDVYGKGIRPKTKLEKRASGAVFRDELPLFRRRMADGLDTLIKTGKVDPKRVAAIGYCFGGQAVLELARSGADVRGVVSFHGSLLTTMPAEAGKVKARVLVLHGAKDPNANSTIETTVTLSKELETANVDYEIVLYAKAVHAFTKKGDRYNEKADKRSWRAMTAFLADVLK